MLRVVGNIIWLVFGGLVMALGYLIAALVMFILIITIPFGLQALKMASFTLWPFGRTLVKRESAGGLSLLGNVIWLILAGWWLALGHLIFAIAQFVTIIGIPLGLASLKLIPVSLWPFGHEIYPIDEVPAGETARVAVEPRTAERIGA